MPIKRATGRESRAKHSTLSAPGQVERARRHPRPRYSTGESASIAHVTGQATDCRALEREAESAAATPLAK